MERCYTAGFGDIPDLFDVGELHVLKEEPIEMIELLIVFVLGVQKPLEFLIEAC